MGGFVGGRAGGGGTEGSTDGGGEGDNGGELRRGGGAVGCGGVGLFFGGRGRGLVGFLILVLVFSCFDIFSLSFPLIPKTYLWRICD